MNTRGLPNTFHMYVSVAEVENADGQADENAQPISLSAAADYATLAAPQEAMPRNVCFTIWMNFASDDATRLIGMGTFFLFRD